MAKFKYNQGKQEILGGTTSWTTAIRAWLVDGTYAAAASLSADDHLDDVAALNRIGSAAVAITNPTIVHGVASCDAITFSSVAGGTTIAGVVFYKHTGTESTSTLVYFDGEDSGGTPFALATNGGNIVFTPNASGLFAI